MKIHEIFWENRLKFEEQYKIIKNWGMISIGQVKLSNFPAKFCAFGPKMKKILKKFKKMFRFLIKISMEKWLFSQFFNYIFLGFLPPLRKYIPLEDNTRFLQQFFRFRGGGTFRRPPPSRRHWLSQTPFNDHHSALH